MLKKTINNYIFKLLVDYIEYNQTLANINLLVNEEDSIIYNDLIKSFPRNKRKWAVDIIYRMVALVGDSTLIYNSLALYKFTNNIVLTKWGIIWLRLKNLLSKN